MTLKSNLVAAVAIAGTAFITPLTAQTTGLSAADRLHGLATFWKEVDYNFAYFDQVPELDWDAAFRDHISRALQAKDNVAYYRVLQSMCALLHDGHTNIYPPPGVWRAFDTPPIQLREVQHRAIVDNVARSLSAQLPIASEILTIDGLGVTAHLEQHVFPLISTSAEHMRWESAIRGNRKQGTGLLAGPSGSLVVLGIRDPDGAEREIQLVRNRHDMEVDWLRNRQHKSRLEYELGPDGIAMLALNTFGDSDIVAEFEALLPELRQAKALLIDLRANGGGNTSIATGILRYLTDRQLAGSTWRTREHNAAFKAWGTLAKRGSLRSLRYRKFARGRAWHKGGSSSLMPAKGASILVPTAVLIGHGTASAAEDFLVYAETLEHFTTFGEATFGSTGQPLMLDLPGSGRARICTKRDTFPDGRDFVGSGIEPDVFVSVALADIRADRDPAMAAALAHLRERIK